ncbi:MAG: AsmA-like C-terminal region-containing protein [Pseudomonadota bacterium]
MSSAEPTAKDARRAARKERRRFWRRHGLPNLLFSLLLATLFGGVLYLLMGRPVHAPQWLVDRIQTQVAASTDQGSLAFDTLDFVIEDTRYPRVRMNNVRVLSAAGDEIVGFAEMRAGLSLPALLSGKFELTSVDVSGVFASLRRERDGSVVLSGGFDLGAPARQEANFGALIQRLDTLLAAPALAQLRSAELQALTLRLEDVRLGRAWTIDGGRVRAERSGDTLRLTSNLALLSGGQGVATLDANYSSEIGSSAAQFGLNVTDVAAADIAAIAAPLAWLEVLRAPISGAMRGGIDAAGNPTELSATLSISEGVLQPTDATRPIPFTSAQTYMAYDPATGVMRFDALSVASDWITAQLDGQTLLNISDDEGLTDLVGQFRAAQLSANPDNLYADAISLDGAGADFRLSFNPFHLEVGQVIFEDEGQALVAHGDLRAETGGWAYGLDAQMDGLAPARLIELWPEIVATKTREWIAENVRGGQLSALDFVLRDGPERDADIYLSFDYSDAEVQFMKTLPPLTGGRGSASLLDGRFVALVDQGQVTAPSGGVMDVAGSSFIVPDIGVRDGAPGVVRLTLDGPVPAALSLLDQPPLNVMQKAGLSPDVASGRLLAEGTLSLPLRKGIDTSEIRYDATGRAFDVVSDDLIEGRQLRAEQLQIVASDTGVTVTGPGTLEGIPFDATWRQPIGQGPQPSTVTGQVALSQAAVDAFDIGLPPGSLRGTGQGNFEVTLPTGGAAPTLSLTSTLAGLGLSIPALGWSIGQSATGAFSTDVTLGDTPRVDRIALEAGGLQAAGTVTLRAGGGLSQARFERVRLGGWLDAPVDLAGQGPGRPPAITVRGGTLDLRAANFGGSGGSSGQSGGPISLALDRLQVTDTIAITGLRGNFSTNAGFQGEFTGAINGAARIEGQVIPQNGRSAVRIRGADAGRVAASAGLLKQARGGDLSLTLLPVGEASFDGTLAIKNTRIQDAPAIAALLNALSIVGLLEQMGGSGIHFQEVEANFRMAPSAITITRASAVGPSMGLSMDGTYNVGSKVLDMQGVISPVYVLNGIGSIFTRKGEGLIGFNYRLKGPASSPQVSVNPLSALTPGMFRNLFRRPPPQVQGGAATTPQAFSEQDDATGETAAERRLREAEQARDER